MKNLYELRGYGLVRVLRAGLFMIQFDTPHEVHVLPRWTFYANAIPVEAL